MPDEAAQRRLLDSVVRTDARLAVIEPEPEEAVLTRVRNALAFLVERTMREMVRDAREYELKALLTGLFGARTAAATVERLRARRGTDHVAYTPGCAASAAGSVSRPTRGDRLPMSTRQRRAHR